MIIGRWAFAGQVTSSLGELDDRVRFARSPVLLLRHNAMK
jgi:hypothetical protein